MLRKVSAVFIMGGLVILLGIFGSYMMGQDSKDNNMDSKEIVDENIKEEMAKEIQSKGITIVVDPGHGGYDPGKVGINGVLEKDINLQISLMLEEELKEIGYDVVMTRTTDTGAQPQGESFGKTKDLDARVQLINEGEPTLAISVHQNSYITEDIKGAQVFYYQESKAGEEIASHIQESLLKMDTQNHRQIKGNTSYYLLNRTTTPTVIVECGFLSNVEEGNKLTQESYQREITAAIIQGIENYLESL